MLLVLCFVAAACGGGDDDDASGGGGGGGGGTTRPEAPVEEVEGCEDGWTDPEGMGPDREPARCEPGAPAPQPLPQREKVVVGTQLAEYAAPILVGDVLGEYEAENIDLEIQVMPANEVFTQLLSGQIDVAYSSANATFMNALVSGAEMRMVFGSNTPPDGGNYSIAQQGLWARRDAFSDPDDPDLADLAGESIGLATGPTSVTMSWMGEAFEEAGVDITTDITFDPIPFADTHTAIQQGAVKAGYVIDPFWSVLAEEPDEYVLLAGPPRAPLSGTFFGANLLNDRPAVADAFARAYVRTINTHLVGDYHSDPEVLEALAESLKLEPEQVTAGTPVLFEWELRAGLTDSFQEWFIRLDQQSGEPLPEDQVVDRSFYERAVGKTS